MSDCVFPGGMGSPFCKDCIYSRGGQVKRWLFSGAGELVPDKQGRVLLPQDLRAFAGLEKDVVVIGAHNKAEIWDKSRWEEMNASLKPEDMRDVLTEAGF